MLHLARSETYLTCSWKFLELQRGLYHHEHYLLAIGDCDKIQYFPRDFMKIDNILYLKMHFQVEFYTD